MAVQHLRDFATIERAVAEHLDVWREHTMSTVPRITGGLAEIVCSCGESWAPDPYGLSADYGTAVSPYG